MRDGCPSTAVSPLKLWNRRDGPAEVDRRDFGVTWNRIFDWGLMAGHERTFSLEIELAYPDESLAQAPRPVE